MSRRDYLKHLGFITAQAMVNVNTTEAMNVNLNNTDNNAYINGFRDGKKAGTIEYESLKERLGEVLKNGIILELRVEKVEAECRKLIDVLEQIKNSQTPYNAYEMEIWIDTARNLSATALAKYKEVSNG